MPTPIPKNEMNFTSDSPVEDLMHDRFGRRPFSQRIAQTIASRKDGSSIIIGIYGPWGEGKTSVLNFITRELASFNNIVSVRFNPWRYDDEGQLIRSFFETLSDALGKSLKNRKEMVGEWVSKYGTAVAPLSIGIPGVQISAGEFAKIGKAVSSVELEDLKKRIEKILAESGKRVVVLMDDIDRLDKNEIHSVFKLVKLTADFEHTAYVLAFDEQIVASALGERYGSGGASAGYSFLEKIVQVPLHLPKASIVALRQFCFEGVDQALSGAEMSLDQEQIDLFVRSFVNGLEACLSTPRMARRLGNALTFSLPLLKGEAHPVDLMLVEGMRVFYPKLYQVVRDNPEIFLEEPKKGRGYEQEYERKGEILESGFQGLSPEQKKSAIDLLQSLFPRTKSRFGNTYYGDEWDQTWSTEQRISSRDYFDRFFSYSIPEGDVSDLELASLIAEVDSKDDEDLLNHFKQLISTRNAESLIRKLRLKANGLTPPKSERFAILMAKSGQQLPNPVNSLWDSPFSRGAMLVAQLLVNIPKGNDRIQIAERVIQNAEPVTFALECFHWMRVGEKDDPDRLFSFEEESQLGVIVAERIKSFCLGKVIYTQFPDQTPMLLSTWATWRGSAETNQYILETLRKDPKNVLLLLRAYLPKGFYIESGLPSPGEFERSQYDSLSKVVHPDTIYELLKEIYGQDLYTEAYPHNFGKVGEEILAKQFVFIHNFVAKERSIKEQVNLASQESIISELENPSS